MKSWKRREVEVKRGPRHRTSCGIRSRSWHEWGVATQDDRGDGSGLTVHCDMKTQTNQKACAARLLIRRVAVVVGAMFLAFQCTYGQSGKPQITAQPTTQTVVVGATAVFQVATAGGPWDYEWLKGGTPISNDARISGASTPTLTITGTQTSDVGEYSVRVYGTEGQVYSEQAQLKVNAAAPQITLHPTNQTVNVGQTVSFTVQAQGTELSYQWVKEGTPLADSGTISGATSSQLVLLNVQGGDVGQYWAVVTDEQGQKATSEAAQLKVNAVPPQITQQPTSQTVMVGQSVSFVVQAQGTELSYQWVKEGTPLADIATISGSTSNMLTILNVQVADAGEYWVVVRDTQEQKVTSEPAQLKVNAPPPQITKQPTNQTVTVGQTAVFVVQAQGTGLGYQWVKEGTPLANSASISGADTNRLVIQNVQVSDAGEYWVVVTDEKC